MPPLDDDPIDLDPIDLEYPVAVTLPVQWGDMDSFAHVNNAVYLRWFESARIALFERVAIASGAPGGKVAPILARASCNYRRPLTYPDTVTVEAAVTKVGRSSFDVAYRVFSAGQVDAAADGDSVVVMVDYGSGASVPLDDRLRAALLDARASAARAVVPAGDPARHLDASAVAAGLAALAAPRDEGHVALLVARGPDHARTCPARAMLAVDAPFPGDRWRPGRSGMDGQLAVMNLGVASLLCNGQDLALPGDNLLLDLDLSEANLPVGSRLAVGAAELEVTPKAHTGCRQFRQRFGAVALRATATPEGRRARLRGLYLRVVVAGEVAVGDAVRVLRRG